MPQQKFATRARLLIPLLLLALAALACNLGAQPPVATTTAQGTAGTQVAQSDVPEVEIRSPADNSEVVIRTEVQIYVRATDRIGVTRIEMRADNLIVDTAASPEANGTTTMDSILSWTPTSGGSHVIQVVAFRGNTRGNPKQITLIVRESPGQVTRPAGSPAFLTASPTNDPTCRVRVDTDNLNVRRGPGINYDRITSLTVGSTAPIIGTIANRSWYQISVQGLVGWVSAAFVTPLGVCTTLINVPIPASPTVPAGATAIIIPPTFTALPTIPLPTPSSTIPVVVLPTLTWTPIPTQGQRPASAGDLTSTAIFATQTKLAQPATATQGPPTQTIAPGVTPTITLTSTATATPQLPNLVIDSVAVSSTTVVLDSVQKLATVPFVIRLSNTGSAVSPVFTVAVDLPDGTRFSGQTSVILNPNSQTELTINVTFTKEGQQRATVIADSANNIVEGNETDNLAFRDMTVVVATVQGATATHTETPTTIPTTSVPTATWTVEPATATFTATVEAPTLVGATATPTFTETPTVEAPTLVGATATNTTEAATATPTFTETPTTEAPTLAGATATATPTFTETPTQAVVIVPTETFTFTPEPPTATPTVVPPTETWTPEPPTVTPVPPTETWTPEPPTATPEPPTATPEPPTATPVPPTETWTPEPPTVTPEPPTATPVPPTETWTPEPPTVTSEPPTATPEPPTATTEPPTATTAAPVDEMLDVPVVPQMPPGLVSSLQQIFAAGQANGVVNGSFKIVGDATLRGVPAVVAPTSNLSQHFPNLDPIKTYFTAGLSDSGINSTANGDMTSGQMLTPGQAGAPCAGDQSPLACALSAKPSIVFISVGRGDIDQNVPVDQFRQNIENAVNTAKTQGTIPVLVTISGVNSPDKTAALMEFNTTLRDVAANANIPLLNVYGIRKDNPALVGDNGRLVDPGAENRSDFSPERLQTAGLNVATVRVMETLEALKNAIPLP